MRQQISLLGCLTLLFVGASCGAMFSEVFNQFWLSTILMMLALLVVILDASSNSKLIQKAHAEKVDALRYRGLYPPKGEGSDDDVKRLKAADEKGVAFRLYLELHAVPLKQAWRDFKAL